MLNELLLLHQTLKSIGVDVTVRHPDIKPLAKRPILRVFLDPESRPTKIEVISSKDAPKYWSIRDGKHNSFPHISLKKDPRNQQKNQPLRPGITELDRKALRNARLAASRLAVLNTLRGRIPIDLSGVVSEGDVWPGDSHRARIRERAETIEQSTKAPNFVELSRRFLIANSTDLLVEIERRLYGHLATNADKESLDLATSLSFHGGCDLLFDCQTKSSDVPAASPQSVSAISAALLSRTKLPEKNGADNECGLSGELGPLVDDKFPEANFPILGPTFLHAKNEQTPCTLRYGFTGPRSMPVNRKLASVLQASAEELTSEERKGKTWRSVAAEKPKISDLLIAFIDKEPDAAVASALIEDEADFKCLAERSCKLLDGRTANIPADARLEILVLRKLDPANKKVVYRASRSVGAFSSYAQEWQTGLRNVPKISFIAPSRKKGDGPRAQGPGFIAPGSIVAILRRIFIRGGIEATESPGPSFADAFRLFTTSSGANQKIPRRLLGITLARCGQLLSGVGHARSRPLKEFQEFDRLSALDVISLLGILLQKLDQPKEKYMNELPYLLGQLLAGVDTLHRAYCLDQRGGSLPPNLLGNSLLPVAEKNPASALAQLLQRLKPYYGWADRTRTTGKLDGRIAQAGKDTPKGKALRQISRGAWAAFRLREIAPAMATELSTMSCPDDIFKAKLLLGYLAGPTKAAFKVPADVGSVAKQEDDTNVNDEI